MSANLGGGAAPAVRAAGASDRGLLRPANEDACLVVPERGLFAVSDGMGGRPGGALASQMVVTLLPALLDRHLGPAVMMSRSEAQLHDALQRAIMALNAEVCQRGEQQAAVRGLGATVALALLAGSVAHIAHLGDSRVYLLRQGALRQVTADHSAAALHGGGAAIARDLPGRHLIARYVGMSGPPVADVATLPLQAGDRLLLSTDGLTGMLPDRLIAHVLRHQPGPEPACRALIGAANAAGGRDNASAIVVFVDSVPPAQPSAPGGW